MIYNVSSQKVWISWLKIFMIIFGNIIEFDLLKNISCSISNYKTLTILFFKSHPCINDHFLIFTMQLLIYIFISSPQISFVLLHALLKLYFFLSIISWWCWISRTCFVGFQAFYYWDGSLESVSFKLNTKSQSLRRKH